MSCFFKVFFSFLTFGMYAQELPPIRNYAPIEYNAENQNWSISQAASKLIYVANNKGLLEYNGARWKLYPSPNESVIRSVKTVGDVIYTGCYMEFGYWEKDNLGQLQYTSLSQKLEIDHIEDEEFWNIHAIGDLMVFQSKRAIYITNLAKGTVNRIASDNTIGKMFKVDQTIYFQRIGIGLYKIEYGRAKLVTDHPAVKTDEVINIFQDGRNLLLLTQNNGFYTLDSKLTLNQAEFTSARLLSDYSFYTAIKSKDEKYILGTISNGLIYLNEDGVFEKQINQTNGLINNTVLSIYEDVSGRLWLGLDNGISLVNTNSPFRVFDDSKGTLGSIYASALHDDLLYIGTNQGLFYKRANSNAAFEFIKNTQGQVWSLQLIDDTLFCGHHSGTYIVEKEKVKKIVDVPGTWRISKFDNNPDLLLQGNYDGLYVLKNDQGSWGLRNKIKGFGNSSRYFEVFENKIFINHEYNGIFELEVDPSFREVQEFKKDTSIRGANSGLVKYREDILYAYKNGILKYSREEDRFVSDSVLNTLYTEGDYESGKLIFNEREDALWVFTKSGISCLTYDILSNQPKVSTIPLANNIRNDVLGYENMLPLGDGKYLLGTASGYIVLNNTNVGTKNFEVRLGEVIFVDAPSSRTNKDVKTKGSFDSGPSSIEISFYVPEYYKLLNKQYQYRLSGFYNNWSPWSEDDVVTFDNLPYGDYTFQVRGKIGNKISENIGVYNFSIAKPWYISNLMLGIYVLSVVSFSILMHTIYKRYYTRQREKLMERNKKELAWNKIQSEKEIINIKNAQLELENKAKSKELAASTMNIIKKNELLSNIKDELLQIDHKETMKPVIQIIDKNLNQNDDWELFQEAFNNTDSGFLKKIKELHPSVSPSDLKLCVYLRLNLSSKEIAQLLHISPRSVEIKRYRLRKKLELRHEDNLANYILGL